MIFNITWHHLTHEGLDHKQQNSHKASRGNKSGGCKFKFSKSRGTCGTRAVFEQNLLKLDTLSWMMLFIDCHSDTVLNCI